MHLPREKKNGTPLMMIIIPKGGFATFDLVKEF